MTELDQTGGHGFDQRSWAANVDTRPLARRPRDRLEHCAVNPAFESGPSLGLFAGERVIDFEACVLRCEAGELVPVDHVVPFARRVQQPHRKLEPDNCVCRSECAVAMAQHRHQGYDARAATDEEERSTRRNIPNEVAADRAAKLELVSRDELVEQIGRDFTVVETLDCEREVRLFGRRGYGVAPLRLLSVFRREPHVNVLPGAMARPPGHVEDEGAGLRRFFRYIDHGSGTPDNLWSRGNTGHSSPAYRCSRQGSP